MGIQDKPKEFDLGNGIFVNKKGDVCGEFQFNVYYNGNVVDFNIPIKTTIDKIKQDNEKIEANKINPDSCEREPKEDEIKIHVNDVEKYRKILPLGHELSKKLVDAVTRTILCNGCNNIIITRCEYDELERWLKRHNESEIRQKKVYDLLAKGKELERCGDINAAIIIYNEVIKIGYDGPGYNKNKPFERLTILYRKNKDVDNEIRIIEKAIRVILPHISHADTMYQNRKEKISSILRTCDNVMEDSRFSFYTYHNEVVRYRNRLLRLLGND